MTRSCLKRWDRSINETELGKNITEEQIKEYESRNLLVYTFKQKGGYNKNGTKTGAFEEVFNELTQLLRNNKIEKLLNG